MIGEYIDYSYTSGEGAYLWYRNISVTKFNSDGTIQWITQIPKYQETSQSNDDRLSFSYYFDNHNLYFVYLDLEENVKKFSPKSLKPALSTEKLVLVSAKVNSNGQLKREILEKESSETGQLSSQNNYPFLQKGFIVERRKKKEWSFGQVILSNK